MKDVEPFMIVSGPDHAPVFEVDESEIARIILSECTTSMAEAAIAAHGIIVYLEGRQ